MTIDRDHAMRQPSPALAAALVEQRRDVLSRTEPARVRDTSNAFVLKQGALFVLTRGSGDVPWNLPHALGLYHQDCRFLDGYTLTLNGMEPIALSSSAGPGFESRHELTNPELTDVALHTVVEKDTIAILRQRLLRGGSLRELLTVCNYGQSPVQLQLELRFRAHFDDIFEIRGYVPPLDHQTCTSRVLAEDAVQLACQGRDGAVRSTTLVFSPAPHALDQQRATFDLRLEAAAQTLIAINVTPRKRQGRRQYTTPASRKTNPDRLRTQLDRIEASWPATPSAMRTSNPLLDRVLGRCFRDLALLRSRWNQHHYFAAGIPWYATLFGRDAAIAALQVLPFDTPLARETLLLLAEQQATRSDVYRDAERGKIVHELRNGELARSGLVPQSPAYYGTVDATPLFLILLAQYVEWSGDLALAERLRPAVDAALTWIDQHGDHDGDGHLDYSGAIDQRHLVNQGWKDSSDAIVNFDGSTAEPPIALCEAQAYAYAATRLAAALLLHLGDSGEAVALERRAAARREAFERDFWSDRLGCYVLALQNHGRPAEVITSNAGQVLWSGIASPARAAMVVKQLMSSDMFSGWGIRTLSKNCAAYNPMSYHRGSVWPHDNDLIASGFRRYGHDDASMIVFDALFAAAIGFRDFRLPELYCGFDRRAAEEHPVRYPVACSPQAWAAGAIPHLLQTLLGLRADALARRLEVRRPRLPSKLDWVEVLGLRVGAARVDLRFERAGSDGTADLKASVREGDLNVVRMDVGSAHIER